MSNQQLGSGRRMTLPCKTTKLRIRPTLGTRRRAIKSDRLTIDNSGAVWKLIGSEASKWRMERVYVLALDRKCGTLGLIEIARGTRKTAPAHPKDIFSSLMKLDAVGFILVHNHPSGSPVPSLQDLELTRLLQAVGEVLEIGLIDHVILGHDTYFSFRDEGRL